MTKRYTLRCDRCGHKYVYIVSGVLDETKKFVKIKEAMQFGEPFASKGGGHVKCPFCRIECRADTITKIEYRKDMG